VKYSIVLVVEMADVKVVDYAPSWFRLRALEGVILVERQPVLATRLKFKACQEMVDLEAKNPEARVYAQMGVVGPPHSVRF